MNPLEFEKLIKPLDKNKYHICRILKFDDNNMPYIEFEIFRKDMPSIEYFSEKNEAVLSSKKGNTIEDIKELINKENETRKLI